MQAASSHMRGRRSFLSYNAPHMQVILNNTPIMLPDDATVEDLLQTTKLRNTPCAVEVNTSLVPKKDHPDHTLTQGDRIEIVTLVGGG